MLKNIAMVILTNVLLTGCWLDNTPVGTDKEAPKKMLESDSPERFHDRSDEEDHNLGEGRGEGSGREGAGGGGRGGRM